MSVLFQLCISFLACSGALSSTSCAVRGDCDVKDAIDPNTLLQIRLSTDSEVIDAKESNDMDMGTDLEDADVEDDDIEDVDVEESDGMEEVADVEYDPDLELEEENIGPEAVADYKYPMYEGPTRRRCLRTNTACFKQPKRRCRFMVRTYGGLLQRAGKPSARRIAEGRTFKNHTHKKHMQHIINDHGNKTPMEWQCGAYHADCGAAGHFCAIHKKDMKNLTGHFCDGKSCLTACLARLGGYNKNKVPAWYMYKDFVNIHKCVDSDMKYEMIMCQAYAHSKLPGVKWAFMKHMDDCAKEKGAAGMDELRHTCSKPGVMEKMKDCQNKALAYMWSLSPTTKFNHTGKAKPGRDGKGMAHSKWNHTGKRARWHQRHPDGTGADRHPNKKKTYEEKTHGKPHRRRGPGYPVNHSQQWWAKHGRHGKGNASFFEESPDGSEDEDLFEEEDAWEGEEEDAWEGEEDNDLVEIRS